MAMMMCSLPILFAFCHISHKYINLSDKFLKDSTENQLALNKCEFTILFLQKYPQNILNLIQPNKWELKVKIYCQDIIEKKFLTLQIKWTI